MGLRSYNILCTICARGGSKGVKNKNVRLINGKPLIAHTIELAKSSDLFADIVVSTDCDDIARVASEFGAQVLFKRPEHLASDKAAKLPVIRHAFTETEKILEQITPDINESNQNIEIEDDEIFKKVALLRDEELQMHFQHLKIEIIEA